MNRKLSDKEYFERYSAEVERTFAHHPDMHDHRSRFPWLRGYLGNPHSGIWFVAENPSLGQVERAINPDGNEPTEEAQWFASRGDRLFRESLVAVGFKSGAWDSLGGWNCYITNIIKEADYAEKWKGKSRKSRDKAAILWSPVTIAELMTSRPKLLVLMGKEVEYRFGAFAKSTSLSLPEIMSIPHYSYVAFRADSKRRLGPMHPLRKQEYQQSMRGVRTRFNELTRDQALQL